MVFDKSEKTFRTEMYPDYKAHRPDPPDDLRPQFKFIREAVHAFDLPCLEQDGFEADDLIATYVREASEAGATSTIVSSDKDLMQLVTDGVIMFDTMKDKKIGRAEVIEKFGVPPDKVIEVQALIGDSTDNVPGVPGIGVKTAAQLIAEYGDLETLLQRAPEIKQEKRRQSLIDNAEKARLSKKLVTLDDQVKLDVPIGDLAVHEPDYKRLIAFLKAMEFNSLMRRVAEYSGAEAGEIEAEARFAGHIPSAPSSSAAEVASQTAALGQGTSAAPQLPLGRPAQPGDLARKRGNDGPANFAAAPQALAAARMEAARTAKFDRTKYETVRTVERLNAWIERARESGLVAIDVGAASLDPMQAELCGVALAVAPNEACYVPLGHRQGGEGAGLFRGDVAPEQIAETRCARCFEATVRRYGRAQNRPRSEIRLAAFCAARHRNRGPRRHYADVVCARRRPRQPRAGFRRGAHLQSCRTRHQRTDQGRQDQDYVRRRRHRPGHRVRRREGRHRAAASSRAQAAPCRRTGADGL